MTKNLPAFAISVAISLTVFSLWLGFASGPLEGADKKPENSVYDGLNWRFIGPYRGGRVLAVHGVVGDPLTYYMGAAGGGVWKTTNAGQTWNNLSDKHFNTGTIGAIAVAQSDPNVVYVGTGESPIRGVTTSHGDGVYKSVDAGKSWTHLGLEATRQISALVVDPTNADIALVAAQGNPWGPNKERGIFKTSDGGATWRHVLAIDDWTGASDLVMDPTNPRILYAGLWHHGRTPWYIKSGDTSGGIYRSTDGGETWQEVTAGLPKLVGKIGVAVAPSNPDKVYAIVEAEEGGLFVSTNQGSSWARVNGERLIQARAWYYNHINVDPEDENTLYILNAPLLKSIDGGKTFKPMRAPHGDHHDMWFNPENGQNFINANDGGATVTFDGGKTWSSIYNQPTAQFYRVAADNRTPFWVYGGQQDNSSMGIATDAYDGTIGREDQMTVGGGESAHVGFDADNPRYFYATTINATLTEFDALLQSTRPIKPYPEYVFGRNAADHKYRTNWNAPVLVSRHDPSVIYYGTQMLLKSTDRGQSWEEISPDLTKNDPAHLGLGGGPITNEQSGAEFYNTLFYIAESVSDAATIWTGSDGGLVHITRDGGKSWTNVTPKGVGEAHINAIEPSPHDPATAYIAVAGYKMNDFNPYIYVTRNYGKSWKRLDKGLPKDSFVRVVREDPVKPGMLYAGLEAGAYIHGGGKRDSWQPLKLNMPPVPITDMVIRQDSLVAATQGRGFWIMDDLSVVREASALDKAADFRFFAPQKAVRAVGGTSSTGSGNPVARAKRRGAHLTWYLSPDLAAQKPEISIKISDASGALVRSYSSKKTANDLCRESVSDPRSPLTISTPKAKAGLNSWTWDFRRDAFPCVEDVHIFAGLSGARVVPGTYRVDLVVGSQSASQTLDVVADPRAVKSDTDYAALDTMLVKTGALLSDLLTSVKRGKIAQRQITDQLDLLGDRADMIIRTAARNLIADLKAWEARVTQPKHKTFDDDINWPNMMDVQIRHLVNAMDRADAPVTKGALERYDDLAKAWAMEKAAMADLSSRVRDLAGKLEAAGASLILQP